jgi:hypothetical protein
MDRTIDAKFSKFLIGFKIHERETRGFQRVAVPHSTFRIRRLPPPASATGEESHTTIAVMLLLA